MRGQQTNLEELARRAPGAFSSDFNKKILRKSEGIGLRKSRDIVNNLLTRKYVRVEPVAPRAFSDIFYKDLKRKCSALGTGSSRSIFYRFPIEIRCRNIKELPQEAPTRAAKLSIAE